ncbi:MAG: hypothetical protein IKP66_02565, partial [Lachnospiraceae bacterium]|nr:hypothetical protein [Lachnospiraceae bacterium]
MIISFRSFALTVNNYNRYCEDGKLLNMEISFNDVVAKYNKYGQFKLGDNFMPTGNVDDPLSNEGDRDLANLAVESDTTYRIYGEIDEDLMDYSFYDYEDLTANEIKVYELKSKLEALKVGNQVQERSGYGKYNLRNGKNLIAFLKFAYEFYKNSGEYRVGKKDVNLFKGTVAEGKPVCPMEFLDEYIDLTSTSKVELVNGFDDKFRNCVNSWEYVGSKEIYNSDRIFETLEDIYMGLVYLYPGLKVLESKGIDVDELDDNDRAAIFSLVYEIKGMQPITSENISDMQLTKKFSRIGAGDLIGALIEEEKLDLSMAETIYRYMIEIKYKNNPEALARWICEYEEVVGGEYEPLDAEDLDKFLKAYNVAFTKYGKDVSRATGLDYVFYGYVENPEDFQSKKSLEEATNEFANHLREHFSDSGFYRNRNNANFVAKSYMMAKKICENEAFLDITDIYASDICLVEHSYGYGDYTTEVMLSDTQVVSLEAPIEEGYIDTDRDGVFDTDELGTLEEVNISKLIEAYIDYNELPEEEANKLRENPTVKMYNYISNPTLPDTDFDGRGDLRDRYRALDNSYEMTFDTEAVDSATYDLNIDYRYFYMDNSKYYAELSDMAVVLSNMATKKKGESKNWENKTEGLSGKDIYSLMYHYGNEDIEVHDMRNYYNDSNVCRYAIGQHDTVLYLGRTSNKVRNVITVAIGELPDKTAELTANLYGLLGSNEEYEEYHHIGYDITANRIYEYILKYIDKYNNNQKVFFITGAKSAGGVANLLSKKLIDKFGSSSVYGYTFNAVSSINGNMIPEGKKIPNLKYKSIMNVYNDDEIMTMFTSEETNMY